MALTVLDTGTALARELRRELAARDAAAIERSGQEAARRLPFFLRPLLGGLVGFLAREAELRRQAGIRQAGTSAEGLTRRALAAVLGNAEGDFLLAPGAVIRSRPSARPVELDNLLVGPFGVAVIETKGWAYPCVLEWRDAWLLKGGRRERRKSPLLQLDEARGALLAVARAAGIRARLPIYLAVHFPFLHDLAHVQVAAAVPWEEDAWAWAVGWDGGEALADWLLKKPADDGRLLLGRRLLAHVLADPGPLPSSAR